MKKIKIILGVLVSLTAIYAGFTFSVSHILQDGEKSYDIKQKESLDTNALPDQVFIGHEPLDTSKIITGFGFIVGKDNKGFSRTLLKHSYKPSPHMKEADILNVGIGYKARKDSN